MRDHVKAEIEQHDYNNITHITIKVTRQVQMNCPPVPHFASFGDDWICLQDSDVALELGYFMVEPEGVAMQLLRAAWAIAHEEHRLKQTPFDGDTRSTIRKALDQ